MITTTSISMGIPMTTTTGIHTGTPMSMPTNTPTPTRMPMSTITQRAMGTAMRQRRRPVILRPAPYHLKKK